MPVSDNVKSIVRKLLSDKNSLIHICNDFELNAPHIIVDGASVCLFYILVVGKWLHICDLELFGKGMCSAAAGYPDLESNSASYIWGVHNI